MKIFVRFLLFIVVLALMGPFFIKGPDGKPLWELAEVRQRIVLGWDRLQRKFSSASDSVIDTGAGDVLIYRWQDENGQWNYTQEPPVNVAADTLLIDPETNLVSMPPLPDAAQQAEAESDGEVAVAEPVRGPLPDVEQTRQLIEDARALQDKVDERDKKLREIR